MPFFSASNDVRDVLAVNGLRVAESMIARGFDVNFIMVALRETFDARLGRTMPSQVYQAIIGRAEAALQSGATLQRRRSNRPLDPGEFTGMPGLAQEYEYTVVVKIRDDFSGREFTRPLFIGANESIGKYEIFNLAQEALARAMAGSNPYESPQLPERFHKVGNMRITEALVRIP